jgi:hypothetical protein
MMRKTLFVGMVALAGQLLAGGFYLQLGNPEANTEARKANAVLVIRATGCHDPANADVTATATGMVDGKQQSISLKLTKLHEVGTFALAQQWPKTGKWVIEIVGRNPDQFTNTLVTAGPDGVDRLHAKSDMKPFTRADVESMLE